MLASHKNQFNIRNFTNNYPLLVLGVMLLTFSSLFSYLTLAQHLGLKTQMNDLGNMIQPIYNTAQGNFMYMSNMETVGAQPNRLGGHTNYIFLLFVPLIALFPFPSLLQITQVLLIASGAIPLYLIGKKVFDRSLWLPLIGPVLYLLNPQVQDITLFDFHALSLAMPLVIWAFYFLISNRLKWYWVLCVLIILCKEDLALVTIMLGLYQAIFLKQQRQGLLLSVVSGLFFVVNVFMLMPLFRGGSEWTLIADRYGELGGSVESVATSPLTRPQLLLSKLLETEKLSYLFTLLLSVGLLPLFSLPLLLPTLPHLGINLLSSNQIMHQPFQYYHFAIIMAFMIIASVYGLARLLKNNPEKTRRIAAGVISWAVLYSWAYSPAPYSRVSSLTDFEVTPHHRQIQEIQSLIPREASISVQNNLGPHFATRKNIYTFPEFADQTDFIVLDINDPYSVIRTFPRQRNFIYITSMSLESYTQAVTAVVTNDNYGVVFYTADGWLVLKKGTGKTENHKASEMVQTQLQRLETRYQDYLFSSYSD